MKLIADLQVNECRWCIETNDRAPRFNRFCAQPVRDGSSYCPPHHRIGHSQSQPRPVSPKNSPGWRTVLKMEGTMKSVIILAGALLAGPAMADPAARLEITIPASASTCQAEAGTLAALLAEADGRPMTVQCVISGPDPVFQIAALVPLTEPATGVITPPQDPAEGAPPPSVTPVAAPVLIPDPEPVP